MTTVESISNIPRSIHISTQLLSLGIQVVIIIKIIHLLLFFSKFNLEAVCEVILPLNYI